MQCEACGTENIDGARFCAKCGGLLAVHEEGPDPLIGQMIGGRYRVTAVLGEGGMGKVYVGEQQMGSTIRKVAIKTLHQHLSKDPSVLARFHRECGTVAQLEHPNTIKFFDFGATQDGTLYIAMEFVAGKPLADVLEKEAPLSPERVVKILRQVCGVLDEAHLQGVIHRDLKPDNVVLTNRAGETDFVKVLDFGIAARTEGADAQKEAKLTQQGMVLGTPPYMSPEQFTGKPLDARSDIYSLAVMAYEMLTKKLPFEADTPWQWATQHMTAQPQPFEISAPAANIPPAMRTAILRALSKDRDQRPASARDFFAELSEGARMTVVADPQQSSSSSTAAMAATPDFGASPAMGAPMSPPMHAPAHAHPAPTAPGVAVPAMIAPAPMASRKQGGGKGLIIGLGAVGGILLIAMVVLAARSLKSGDGDEEVRPLTLPTSSATSAGTGITEVPPLDTVPPPIPTPDPSVSAETPPPDPTKPKTSSSSKPSTTPSSKPPAGDACDICLNAAAGGNIAGAANAARNCKDEAKKKQCTQRVRGAAPAAAKAAAFNGQCGAAKAIVAAAEGMGAGSKGLTGAVKTCN
jgi:eukaryotic-like serine/threonine-protein kinase